MILPIPVMTGPPTTPHLALWSWSLWSCCDNPRNFSSLSASMTVLYPESLFPTFSINVPLASNTARMAVTVVVVHDPQHVPSTQ